MESIWFFFVAQLTRVWNEGFWEVCSVQDIRFWPYTPENYQQVRPLKIGRACHFQGLLLLVSWTVKHEIICLSEGILTRWWFQIFFIFTRTWGNDPIWLIFFKWVQTTNQLTYLHISLHVFNPPKTYCFSINTAKKFLLHYLIETYG